MKYENEYLQVDWLDFVPEGQLRALVSSGQSTNKSYVRISENLSGNEECFEMSGSSLSYRGLTSAVSFGESLVCVIDRGLASIVNYKVSPFTFFEVDLDPILGFRELSSKKLLILWSNTDLAIVSQTNCEYRRALFDDELTVDNLEGDTLFLTGYSSLEGRIISKSLSLAEFPQKL